MAIFDFLRRKPSIEGVYKEFEIEEIEKKDFKYWFEKGCQFSSRLIKINPPKSVEERLNNAIMSSGLRTTPAGVFSFTILSIIILFIILIPIALILKTIGIFAMFIPFIFGYFIYSYPPYLADVTKIRACDETVKVILYMVIYLRLTPQLEGAFNFAAKHCTGPLGKDLKEILWGIRIGRYRTLEDGVKSKMDKWLAWDKEFIESMNLLQSLEYELTPERRKAILDKALTYILEATHEKMQAYTRDLKTPMTMVHAMGIAFPLMGLVMFPMIAIFLHESAGGYITSYLALGYTVILPTILFLYLRRIVSKRPGAFSYPDVSHHPDLPPLGKYALKFGNKKILAPVLLTSLLLLLLCSIPAIDHFTKLAGDYYRIQASINSETEWKNYMLNMYESKNIVPLTVTSLTLIIGIAIGLSVYCLGKSYQRLKIRNEIKQLESNFQVSLFDLSEVLSSGVPMEFAIQEIIKKYKRSKLEDTPMYRFFSGIMENMKKLGLTLRTAIFDREYGIMRRYPSLLMRDVMEILLSASGKSSAILSLASHSISSFLEKTKKIELSLIDMLSEVSAALQMQASFIAPFICGIVGAMATDIIVLLQQITKMLVKIEESFFGGLGTGQTMKLSEILGTLQIEKVMPFTVFQVIVGIYMIEIIIILCYFLNGIKSGFDVTTRNVLIGKSLFVGLILYSIVLVVGIMLTKGLVAGAL
ncbi:MAG: hypothetical protein QXQ40_02595 [Candidatus Aenigmatarchaeota archaeon]